MEDADTLATLPKVAKLEAWDEEVAYVACESGRANTTAAAPAKGVLGIFAFKE
jgi:hypothetical protein